MKKTKTLFAAFLILGAMFCFTPKGFGQLTFKNKSNCSNIYVTVMYWDNTSGQLISRGWFKILPGKSRTILSGPLKNRYYYFLADGYNNENDDTYEWRGDYTGLIHKNDRFRIEKANCSCSKVGEYVWSKFLQIDVGTSTKWTKGLTIGNEKGCVCHAVPSGRNKG